MKEEMTKSVTAINASEELFNEVVESEMLSAWIQMADNVIRKMKETLEIAREKHWWVKLENQDLYYIPYLRVFLPDIRKFSLKPDRLRSNMPGELDGKMMNRGLVEELFCENRNGKKNPFIDKKCPEEITCVVDGKKTSKSYVFYSNGRDKYGCLKYDGSNRSWDITDGDSLKIPYYDALKSANLGEEIEYFIKNKFFLKNVNDDKVHFVYECYQEGVFEYNGESVGIKNIDVIDKKSDIVSSYNSDLKREDIEKRIVEQNISEGAMECVRKFYLESEKRRINMGKHEESCLNDPESGHWDLWNDAENTERRIKLTQSLIARNPVYDALNNKSGVIGIDFGTKSTVVTFRKNRADILPMRIGSAKLDCAPSKKDYENPTIMELRNVEDFMERYKRSEGRPETLWEDIVISHEAAEQLESEQNSNSQFSNFIGELKQWASNRDRQLKVIDQKGMEISLPPYLELNEENKMDPLEIYAYYLGTFINNRLQGSIYLRYKLSFPATAEKEVKDKILKSFTNGIKKSLPVAVLHNEECKKIFRVEQGASEPSAYAICALQEFGFEPEKDEKVYYAIFDFGGGTTDFDFGIWSCEKKEVENYDYELTDIGQSGNPYLGGENLLEYLAYEVFKNNCEKLREKKIVFCKPYGSEEETGYEDLIKNTSQAANLNTKWLKEKLRDVWERNEDTRKQIEKDHSISISLLDENEELQANMPLDVDLQELDQILEKKIRNGMIQFFDAMKLSFNISDKTSKIEKVNIFLAGNSSKSPLVMKLLKEEVVDKVNNALKENSNKKEDYFSVYPPLGTTQANKIQTGELQPQIDAIIEDMQEMEKENIEQEAEPKEEQRVESEQKKEAQKQVTVVLGRVVNEKKDNGEEDVIELPDKSKMQEEKHEAPVEVNSKESENVISYDDFKKPTGKTGVAFGLLDNRVRIVNKMSDEIKFRFYLGQERRKKFYCAIDRETPYKKWIRFCAASREEFDIWYTQSPTATTNSMSIKEIGIYSETCFIEEADENKSVYIRLVGPTKLEYTVATEERIKDKISENEITQISLNEK